MKKLRTQFSFLIICMMLIPGIVLADHIRNQTIQLNKGWNVVYLEVDPEVYDPDKAFENLPVDLVATFYGQVSSIQYIEDPGETNWKTYGWHKWMKPDAPDAFLKGCRYFTTTPYLFKNIIF